MDWLKSYGDAMQRLGATKYAVKTAVAAIREAQSARTGEERQKALELALKRLDSAVAA